jgi:methylated-DNA-[protein]-cysteine S-methyltransferase
MALACSWTRIASDFGYAGVIVRNDGVVVRVLLPCPTSEQLLESIGVAYEALRQSCMRRGKRPEEASPPPGAARAFPARFPLPPEGGVSTREAARQMSDYFSGCRRRFDLPMEWSGLLGFSRDALQAALDIPYGQTRSYWWVAVRAGNPRAVRAVGQAMAGNPLPLLIPCHRVVRSDGSLGGFGGGGPELKRRLIAFEQSAIGPFPAIPAMRPGKLKG